MRRSRRPGGASLGREYRDDPYQRSPSSRVERKRDRVHAGRKAVLTSQPRDRTRIRPAAHRSSSKRWPGAIRPIPPPSTTWEEGSGSCHPESWEGGGRRATNVLHMENGPQTGSGPGCSGLHFIVGELAKRRPSSPASKPRTRRAVGWDVRGLGRRSEGRGAPCRVEGRRSLACSRVGGLGSKARGPEGLGSRRQGFLPHGTCILSQWAFAWRWPARCSPLAPRASTPLLRSRAAATATW